MDNIEEIRIKIGAIDTLERKLAACSERIKEAEERVCGLLKECEKQKLNVRKIQDESLYSFFLKLLGRYREKLKKEEREEIEAKLEYDRVAAELEELKKEKQELENKINQLLMLEYRYQAELDRRRAAAVRLEGEKGDKFRQLECENDLIIGRLAETGQALAAALRSRQSAECVLHAFKKAEIWAVYCLTESGGLISHLAKYSHIDNAESAFNRLISHLKSLQAELMDDIEGVELTCISQITSAERILDYWMDDFVIDSFICEKIRENIAGLQDLISSIADIEDLLNKRSQQLENQLCHNRRLQQELLVNFK